MKRKTVEKIESVDYWDKKITLVGVVFGHLKG